MVLNEQENDTLSQRGKIVYETQLRATLDTPENRGKILTIEPDSGDYEINGDLLQAINALRARHSEKLVYAMRIGHATLGHLRGGRMVRK